MSVKDFVAGEMSANSKEDVARVMLWGDFDAAKRAVAKCKDEKILKEIYFQAIQKDKDKIRNLVGKRMDELKIEHRKLNF